MASPSITYTLTNGSTADASQVMQNFNDIINSLTDGSKSLSIDALTCAGSVSFQGNVTLGNGTPDDITVSGSLASSIPIKTNNSFDVGTSTLGLASVYLGAPSSRTIRLRANQSLGASYTLIFPPTTGNSGEYMESDGSGGLTFVPVRRSPNTASNYALSASVGSNQLTVTMLGADGSAISSSNPVHVVRRNSTAATGTPTVNTITSTPTSIVLPNGATLGHANAQDQFIYVYLIFGTATEIAVSGTPIFDEGSLQSATAVTSGSTSGGVLYATSNHSAKPIRLVGRIKSNQTTAGTWASVPLEISLFPFNAPRNASARYYNSTNQAFTGSDTILNFDTAVYDAKSAVTTGSSWKYACQDPGKYHVHGQLLTSGSSSSSATNIYSVSVFKNGSVNAATRVTALTTTAYRKAIVYTVTVDCAVGDTLDVRISASNSGDSHSVSGSTTDTFVCIELQTY